MAKWIGAALAFLAAAGLFYFFWLGPTGFDRRANAVIEHEPIPISEAARRLHATIAVADLHADTLLWMRDPAQRQTRGQTDLLRLREGGVALQVFTAVTKSPSGLNYEENDAGSDDITLLALAQRWPRAAWNSLFERALYQAGRLDRLERERGETFSFVKSQTDLETALATGKLAGVFGIEGGHPLEGEIDNLDRLYDAGLRVVGLQHFFDNELGGSLHGRSGDGLSDFGRQVVERAEAKSMIIDVAHSSEATVRDVLAMASRPVIVSHTGFNGHCESARNISDETMIAVAERGGLIGVGFWDGAVCAADLSSIVEAILYGVDLVGADHVALGSDFDGTVTTPIDASELAALTQALMEAGLDEETIRKVMGENALRFFMDYLPAA